MLRTTFYQQSLLEVDPDEIRLPANSFERGLRDVLPRLVSIDDFRDLHPSAEGAPTCDPLVLTGMLLLQFRYGIPDEELIAQCRCDLRFRYALALQKGKAPPSSGSLKRFRAAIREKKGAEWLFRLSLRLPVERGLVDRSELQGVDSTNTECRGAVIDTYNLISAAIRQVVRAVARALDRKPDALAREWGVARYLARSVKGQAALDWSDEAARNAFLTSEIADVDRVAERVAGLGVALPKDVTEAVELMRGVAVQDVEMLPDGTYRIAHGTAAGRVISLTDSEARHGRKSASKTITGFKTHVAGTLESQFVTGITITAANVHDAAPTPELVAQADAVGLKPDEMLGDAAYGTGANLRACAEMGVKVRTKLPTPSHKGFTKREFKVDLEKVEATCPGGQTSSKCTMVKDPSGSGELVPRLHFAAAACRECPLRAKCSTATAEGGHRTITLNHHEREIQDAQAFNARADAKAILRKRSAVERLIAHLVRMGMRQARFFGMQMVQFQAFMTAAAYNLQRYITLTTAA